MRTDKDLPLRRVILVARSKCTRPLRLPFVKPACFRTQGDWDIYRGLANYSAGDGFTFCTDCTKEHRDLMVTEGRCKYPQTQFVKTPGGITVGRRGHGRHRPSRTTKPITLHPPVRLQ